MSSAICPDWFRAALNIEPERKFLTVDGAAIETLLWGDPALPGLLLMHGGGAHADWWSFIAPMLIDRYRVVAFSWSGMGRSSWRDAYSIRSYAHEARAIAAQTGLLDQPVPPIWVAHSFGGHPALLAAAETPHLMSALVLIDTGGFPAPGVVENFTYSTRPSPIYPLREEAVARFRFVPPDRNAPCYIRDHIAERSVTRQEGDEAGWRWSFDFSMWNRLDRTPDVENLLTAAAAPIGFIMGEKSQIMATDANARIRGARHSATPIVTVPDAGHHVMIDQPIAFVSALNGLLAAWPA